MEPTQTKRRKLSLPLALNRQPGEEEIEESWLNHFAARGDRIKELEDKHEALVGAYETLRKRLEISEKEASISNETTRLKLQSADALKEQYQLEQKAAEDACKKEMGRCAGALSKLKIAENDKQKALEAAERAQQQLVEVRGSYKQEQLLAQAKIKKLENELTTLKHDFRLATASVAPVTNLETKELRELQKQLQDTEAQLEEESKAQRSLQVQLAEQQQLAWSLKDALRKATKDSDGSNENIIKALRSELKSQEAEIAKARKLQERIQSIGVLQEKLEAAEGRATRAERAAKENSALQLGSQISGLEAQIQMWETRAQDVGVETPEEIFEKLQLLRDELLAANKALGAANLDAKKSKALQSAAEAQKAEAEAALHNAQGANAELSAMAARFERKVKLIAKEKEGLEKMLASYASEDAAFGREPGKQSAVQPLVQQNEVDNLAAEVGECKLQIEQLEGELGESALRNKQLQEQLADAVAHVAELKGGSERATGEIQSLTAEVEELQGRVDRGEFNSSNTRVLHYVLNPEAAARSEQQELRISALQQEVALLKVQLEKAGAASGEQRGTSSAGGLSAASHVLEAELVVLKQKVAELTKREQRLRDVFQKQVSEFREAVCQLFGYRMDMAVEATVATSRSQATTFVLKPKGHEDNRYMQLVFQFKHNKMHLVPNEFSTRKLKREVETFIDRFDSIPALTANWTMELFQKNNQS